MTLPGPPAGACPTLAPMLTISSALYEKIVVGESRQLEALRAGACVRDDVPALLEDALQSPTHPIVAAGNQRKRRTFNGQLH